ncbi:MAG: TetR/AcrR family transcriptional regulator [Chlorobi bacterium]|nr:TetR/AcrR family transcriptional regulator [Chlorobiota bacterium]
MKEKTRRKILEVAASLFAQYGFHKTSMDEIARVARKAKGSLYYHFTSKEELFTEVVSQEFEKLKAELVKIVESDKLNPIEKTTSFLLKRNQMLATSPNYHETLKADLYERFEFLDTLRKKHDEWEKGQMEKILNEGIEKGYYRDMGDVKIILDVFYMILKGLEIPFFIQKQYIALRPHLKGMVGIMLRGIAASPEKLLG